MAKLQAGVGRAVITPPAGIEMGGWALRKGLSQGVHDEMLARAVVLDDANTAAAIVSLDVAIVSNAMTAQVRDLVSEQTGIPPAHILLNCSHTHTTPYSWSEGRELEGLSAGHQAYLKALPYQIAGAIIEAWHQREAAAIGAGTIDLPGISINRRDPALPVDSQLGVIRIDDGEGQPMACLVNYGCHATTVGAHYLEWTADYPGYLARTIETAEPGCAGMFLQGAEGDVHPWDWYFGNATPRFGDTYEAAERLGQAIAGPALGLFHQIETTPGAEIQVDTRSLSLSPRPVNWTAEEAEAYLAHLEATVEPHQGDVIPDRCPGCMSAQRFPEEYRLYGARHEARFARDYPATIEAELTVFRINDIVLAATQGELFSQLSLDIKAASPHPYTFILSVTNGWLGYIPTRDAAEAVLAFPLEEFTDPVKHRRHYGATITTELGPTAGEKIVSEVLHLIRQQDERRQK